VRPNTEFSLVDEMPDSVQHLDRPAAAARRRGAPRLRCASAARLGLRPARRRAAGRTAGHAAAPTRGAGRRPARGRRRTGCSRSSSTATACWRAPKAARCAWSPATATTGRRGSGLRQALQAMELPDGWYDGEIIMPGSDTPADFQALQGAFDSEAHRPHRLLPVRPAVLRRPRPARRAAGRAPRRAAAHRPAQAARQRALQRGVRGAAAGDAGVGLPPRAGRRHRQAPRLGYVGRRSSDWIKLKCKRTGRSS
jgi:bifunctional non-homologous end joining protein LigD